MVLILVAGGLALIGDGEGGYWTDHPLLASIVSGLLVLALAGTAVERLLRIREERRWRGVAALACTTIADEVTRSVTATLYALWRDAGYEAPARDDPLPELVPERLLPEWEVREVPDGREQVAVLGSGQAVAAGPSGTLPSGRLAELMRDPDWRRWACRHLRELHAKSRPVLAQWAPVMLPPQEPRDLLDDAALVVDHLSYLREDILTERLAAEPEELERRWLALDVQARVLTNSLWKEAGETDWCFELPDDPEADRYRLWRDPYKRRGG